MTAELSEYDDLTPAGHLELRADDVERMSEHETVGLLRRRFQLFLGFGCDWQLALSLAVTPDVPLDAMRWSSPQAARLH